MKNPMQIPEEYIPYIDLLKRGNPLNSAVILKAYARPLYGELWVVMNEITSDARLEFARLNRDIADDEIMPVLFRSKKFSNSILPADAIELEVFHG